MEKIKVYVAGKLNDDAVGYNKNRSRMMKTALMLHQKGFSVFVPCLLEQVGLIDGDWEYEDYFDNSIPWLLVSDAIYLTPGWETSEGTKREIEISKERGIPVFDNLQEMIVWFSNIKFV